MLPNYVEKLAPITEKRRQSDGDKKYREIRFVKKSKSGEQTNEQCVSQFALLIPTNHEIKTGAATEEARTCNAPVQHRKKEKRWIEYEKNACNQRRRQTEPGSGGQHEKKQSDQLPE